MKIYSKTDDYILYEGNMLDMGEVIADNFAAGYTDEITEEQQKGQLTIFDILGGAS